MSVHATKRWHSKQVRSYEPARVCDNYNVGLSLSNPIYMFVWIPNNTINGVVGAKSIRKIFKVALKERWRYTKSIFSLAYYTNNGKGFAVRSLRDEMLQAMTRDSIIAQN